MRTRTLGKTGVRVSELGFGGWAIGGSGFGNSYGPTDDGQSRAAVRRALEQGITLLDTADVYGFGHSEALIGEVLREWNGPPPVVVTKGGVNFYRQDGTLEGDWTPYGIAHAVQQSLMRLRRETLDVFLLMNPPVQDLERYRTWEAVAALKRSGKVKWAGASVASPEDGVWLLKHNAPADVLEVAFSIFYQGASMELLPLAKKKKVGILAREPLANGFLTGKYTPETAFPDGDMRAALPAEYVRAMTDTAAQLSFLAREPGSQEQRGRTLTQAALRFALDADGIGCVVAGAKTAAQVDENVAACDAPSIAEAEREQMMQIFNL